MANNIKINGIQPSQLPTEDSPAGFEAIGYKSGRTSKVSLDTLATKAELQDTVVGTNLLGSKANVATIKSEVTTPSKGDTYKATDTGNYWKYNDVISETNPYDPNKWVDIGAVIPSDVMLNGGSTKTGAQIINDTANRTVSGANTPKALIFRNGGNRPETGEFYFSPTVLTNWEKLPILTKSFSASVKSGYQFAVIYFSESGSRLSNTPFSVSKVDEIFPVNATRFCVVIRRENTQIINAYDTHGFVSEGLYSLNSDRIITESDIQVNTFANSDEIKLTTKTGSTVDLSQYKKSNTYISVDEATGLVYSISNAKTVDTYVIPVNEGDTVYLTTASSTRIPQAILLRGEAITVENIIYPLIAATDQINPLILDNVELTIPIGSGATHLYVMGRNSNHAAYIPAYKLRIDKPNTGNIARTYTAEYIDKLVSGIGKDLDITQTLGLSFNNRNGQSTSFPNNERLLIRFAASKTVKIWVKDGYEFLVGRWDSVGNFLFADLGFSYRNQHMILPKFDGVYNVILRRTDLQPMQEVEISNLVFESDNTLNFDWWEVPAQPNDFELLQINATDFLAQYYDIYLQDEQRDYTKIDESDVNGWLPYTFVKNSLGKEYSGQYDIYEYVFTPKRYNRTIMLSALMHGQEIVGGFSLMRFFHYLFNDRGVHPIFDYIYNNVRIISIPVVNPYGFSQWPRQFGTANGSININWNFDEHGSWHYNTANPSSVWEKKGSAPWSEIETRILRDWLNKYKSDAMFWIDMHTGAGWDQDVWAYYVDTDGWLKPRMIEASAWLSKTLYSEVGGTLKNLIQDRWTSEKLHYAYRMLGIPCMTIEHVPGRYGGYEGGSRDLQVYLRALSNYIISFLNNKPYGNTTEDLELLKNEVSKLKRYEHEPVIWDESGEKYRLRVSSNTGNIVSQKINGVLYNNDIPEGISVPGDYIHLSISQADYNSLAVKDPNTIYYVY